MKSRFFIAMNFGDEKPALLNKNILFDDYELDFLDDFICFYKLENAVDFLALLRLNYTHLESAIVINIDEPKKNADGWLIAVIFNDEVYYWTDNQDNLWSTNVNEGARITDAKEAFFIRANLTSPFEGEELNVVK